MTEIDLKENRTIKEWLTIMPSNWLDKFSLVILSAWCLLPITLMLTNLFCFSITSDVNYMVMLSVGVLGGLVGLLSFFKGRIARAEQATVKLTAKLFFWKYGDRLFLVAMLIWGFISCFFAKDMYTAFVGNEYRHDGFISYLAYAGFFSAAVTLKNEKYRKILLHIFCVVSTLMAVITILQFYGVRVRVFINFLGMHSAVFNNSNHYGYYLVLAMIVLTGLFIFQKKWWIRGVYAVGLAISVFALAINNTFAAYWAVGIGILFAIIFLAVTKKEKFLILLIPLLVFIAVSVWADVNYQLVRGNFGGLLEDFFNLAKQENLDRVGTNRIKLWGDSIQIIKKYPVFGCGIEGFLNGYDGTMKVTYDRPHNEYLQHATFMGIPAGICYLVGLSWIIGRACRKNKSATASTMIALCAVIGYCFSAFFGNTMFYTTPYFIMVLAMASKNEEWYDNDD